MKTIACLALLAAWALPLPAPAADTAARLDPDHSSATFTVKHLTITKVSGTIPIKSATIVVGSDGILKEADATLDLTSLDTHQGQRDGALRSDQFFDVATYPLMTFKSTKIETAGGGNLRVTGDLTFHGVTKPVTLETTYNGTVKDGHGRTHVGYSATATVDRTAWNLGATFPPAVVGNDVTIDLEVDAIEG